MDDIFIRSKQLLGEKTFTKFKNARFLLVGVGGVGSTLLTSLVRSGATHFFIVDGDKVESSNLNRQALYDLNNLGKFKVAVAKEKLLKINPSLDIKTLPKFYDTTLNSLIDEYQPDFILDAIDDMPNKINLYDYARKNDIPLITSMGAAKRIDPTLVRAGKIMETKGDALAKIYRHKIKELDGEVYVKAYAVYSIELPLSRGKELASLAFVPQSFGLTMASIVIKLLKEGD